MYREVVGKNGKKMFYKDGKLISKADYEARDKEPAEPTSEPIVEPGVAVEVEEIIEDPKKVCIFCGQKATHIRAVGLQIIDLCEEDYLGKTVGEIAEKLNG